MPLTPSAMLRGLVFAEDCRHSHCQHSYERPTSTERWLESPPWQRAHAANKRRVLRGRIQQAHYFRGGVDSGPFILFAPVPKRTL